MHKLLLKLKTRVVFTSYMFLYASVSFGVDIIPGQAIAPTPYLNIAMISFLNMKSGDKYLNGDALGLNTEVTASSLFLRYTRTFLISNKPAGFYIQPTISQIKPAGSVSAEDDSYGIGDTAFAFAYWPYSNRVSGTYLGLAGYLVTPTGEYNSNELINIGQNRYQSAIQVAYHTKLNDYFDVTISTDIMWFTKNHDYRLTHQTQKQKALYSSQATLMHNIDKRYLLAVSYFIHEGAETQLDDINQNDELKKDRYSLSVQGKFDFGKLILEWGHDFDTENGFIEERRLFLRYQMAWK